MYHMQCYVTSDIQFTCYEYNVSQYRYVKHHTPYIIQQPMNVGIKVCFIYLGYGQLHVHI